MRCPFSLLLSVQNMKYLIHVRQLRQKPVSPGFSAAGYCRGSSSRGKSMPRIHFNLKDLLRALFVPRVFSNNLNTVRWSVSGTFNTDYVSSPLGQCLASVHITVFSKAFILTWANPILSPLCFLPKYCGWSHHSQNETISEFPNMLWEKYSSPIAHATVWHSQCLTT